MRLRPALALLLALAACGGAGAVSAPASQGVRAYVAALAADDPASAYRLLAADVRATVSFDEFARTWKQSARERAWQRQALEDSLRGTPDVGERAQIQFADGRRVQLEREGTVWRLEAALVSRSRAKRPRDAIRLFADAIAQRDLAGMLGVLSQRRREALTRQVEGFVSGIGRRLDDQIDEFGSDRAELRWDEDGLRYRIVLRKEDDEWRVDDIHIRPAPAAEADDDDDELDGSELLDAL